MQGQTREIDEGIGPDQIRASEGRGLPDSSCYAVVAGTAAACRSPDDACQALDLTVTRGWGDGSVARRGAMRLIQKRHDDIGENLSLGLRIAAQSCFA